MNTRTKSEVCPKDYHIKLKCNRENIFDENSYISKSVLWELVDSSLWRWRHHPRSVEPTSAMSWGSLIDCLTTTPELIPEAISVSFFESYRTAEAKKWKEEREAEGKIIVSVEQFAEAKEAARMLLEECPQSSDVFKKSKSQVVVLAKIGGVKAKGLVDLAPEGEDYLADLKTTGDFTFSGFEKTAAKYGYHCQAAMYLMLWNAMYPDDKRDRFKIIWQYNKAPYEVCVQELNKADIENGKTMLFYLLEKLVKAYKDNHFPMLGGDGEKTLVLPTWSQIKQEESILD